jgi:hypothetical protein
MADEPRRYHGIYKKQTKVPKWAAAITVKGEKYYLGSWRDQESAARAYDWMAIVHLGANAQLNFPEFRATAQQRAPRDMRFVTRAQEIEHRQAERQLALRRRQEQEAEAYLDALRRDPQVMADQYAWFGGGRSTARQQHDHEAGPSTARQQHGQEAGPSGAPQQHVQEDNWWDASDSDDSYDDDPFAYDVDWAEIDAEHSD